MVEKMVEKMVEIIPESQIFSVCYPSVELGAGTFHSHINIESIKFSIFPSYNHKKPRPDVYLINRRIPFPKRNKLSGLSICFKNCHFSYNSFK